MNFSYDSNICSKITLKNKVLEVLNSHFYDTMVIDNNIDHELDYDMENLFDKNYFYDNIANKHIEFYYRESIIDRTSIKYYVDIKDKNHHHHHTHTHAHHTHDETNVLLSPTSSSSSQPYLSQNLSSGSLYKQKQASSIKQSTSSSTVLSSSPSSLYTQQYENQKITEKQDITTKIAFITTTTTATSPSTSQQLHSSSSSSSQSQLSPLLSHQEQKTMYNNNNNSKLEIRSAYDNEEFILHKPINVDDDNYLYDNNDDDDENDDDDSDDDDIFNRIAFDDNNAHTPYKNMDVYASPSSYNQRNIHNDNYNDDDESDDDYGIFDITQSQVQYQSSPSSPSIFSSLTSSSLPLYSINQHHQQQQQQQQQPDEELYYSNNSLVFNKYKLRNNSIKIDTIFDEINQDHIDYEYNEHLKNVSLKNATTLIGWKIRIFGEESTPSKGIYIITRLRKKMSRKTEYRCKNLYMKKWVILERRADKPGVKFQLLQKVLDTK